MPSSPTWRIFLVYFGLGLIADHSCWPFSPPYTVIESDMAPEMELHVVTEANHPIKLRCHELSGKAGSRVDDIIWEYKKCGYGLSLTACEDLSKDAAWQFALCRNHTKLCTGSTLPISDPSESDSGLYRCLHKNYMMRKFRVNRTVQLEVRDYRTESIQVLPEGVLVDNQTVFENQTAVLRCRVRSVTFPHIVWARFVTSVDHVTEPVVTISGVPYQFLNASVTHDGPDKLYTSKLYIPRAKPSDSGVYVCFALDARHRASKQVSLTVVPACLDYRESSTNYEVWWIAVVLALSATSCVLVLFFLLLRNRPKMVPVPTDDVFHSLGSSSETPTPLC